jgi:hypothetical protein
MKELLTLILALVALATFTGFGAAQEKNKPKAGERDLPADKVELRPSASRPQPLNACGVIVRPFLSSKPGAKYSNQPVFFEKLSGTGNPPHPGTTDANGVLMRNVASGQKIRAVLGAPPKKLDSIVSKDFDCALQPAQ